MVPVLDPNAPEQTAVRLFYTARMLPRSARADVGSGRLVRIERARVPTDQTFGFYLGTNTGNGGHVWFLLLVVPGESNDQLGLARVWASQSDETPTLLGVPGAYPLWRIS